MTISKNPLVEDISARYLRNLERAIDLADTDRDGTISSNEHANFARSDDQLAGYADDFALAGETRQTAEMVAVLRTRVPGFFARIGGSDGRVNLSEMRMTAPTYMMAEYRALTGRSTVRTTTVRWLAAAQDQAVRYFANPADREATRTPLRHLPAALREMFAYEGSDPAVAYFTMTVDHRTCYIVQSDHGVALYLADGTPIGDGTFADGPTRLRFAAPIPSVTPSTIPDAAE